MLDVENLRRRVAGSGLIVALDGPSGSGKSTVAKKVSDLLDLAYLDTGAMYRAATVVLLDHHVDLDDPAASAMAVEKLNFDPARDPYSGAIMVDGEDVQDRIRTEEVSAVVSKLATNLEVRRILVAQQQEIVSEARSCGNGVVVEGRDITTVVAPQADVRAIITASPEVRLARRARELGKSADAAEMRDQVLRRDKDDSTVSQFLTPAPGVTLIDTSELDIAQATEEVLSLVEKARVI